MDRRKHDFVVVGSGGGGGTIAWLLAKAGYDVLLLEQGPDFAAEHRDPHEKFDRKLHDEHFFRLHKPDPKRRPRGDYNTFLDLNTGTSAPFNGGWTASVVGGGSVLWGTWAFRALPIDFKLRTHFEKQKELKSLEEDEGYAIADWPISYGEMMPFFEVAEALLGISGDRKAQNDSVRESRWYRAFEGESYWGTEDQWFPKSKFPLDAYPLTPVGQFFAKGFAHENMRPFPTPVAIVRPGSGEFATRSALAEALQETKGALPGDIWQKKADELWSARIRDACNMCGFCGEYLCWGKTGPKWGTQETTLKELHDLKNAEIRPNSKAIEVMFDVLTRQATGIAYLDTSDPDDPQRKEALARHVIVSCGAVQSARLLFLSGPPQGLGNSTGQLGRYATFHLFGLSMKGLLKERLAGLLHGEFGPTGNVSTFDTYFLKDGAGRWIKGGHLTSTAKKNPLDDAANAVLGGKPAIGETLMNGIADHNRRFEVRLTGDDLPMHDNRVTLDPTCVDEYGVPVARISRRFGANEQRLFKVGQAAMKSVFRYHENKPDVVEKTEPGDARLTLIGDHQMGTCRMGDDPHASVVNRFCRLHDAENVFVVDSSFMPTGLGLNPMVTVVANALRVGTHIIDALKKGHAPGRA